MRFGGLRGLLVSALMTGCVEIDDDNAYKPGQLTGPCVQSQCYGGLLCSSNLCVMPQDPTAPGTTTTGDPDTGAPTTTLQTTGPADPSTTGTSTTVEPTTAEPTTLTATSESSATTEPAPKDPQPASGLYAHCIEGNDCMVAHGCFRELTPENVAVDGFCTAECNGQSDCLPAPDAPAKAVCAPTEPSGNYCVLLCEGDAECPEGMLCKSLGQAFSFCI